MFFEQDNGALFADFAVAASYNGAAIAVIFSEGYKAINAVTGGVESTEPQAICKSADAEAMSHGEQIVINDMAYYITGIEPDGTGITVIVLSK
ncbi:MAG TPA: hypothetical protein VLH56_18120, partial [Dissulfurispiraceae bacterium]|nr:hypothetical protein [Dissulfurispiraceae bacterium]